ncbi:MAG: stage V sporulation protein E, partial [Desulfovibrio sp.]|nr:stage V sporulation protein E [Desulfovibrio sp.]
MSTAAAHPTPGHGPQGRARAVLSEPWILVSALLLAGIGLMMVYSASSALAGKRYMDSSHFVRAQAFHLGVGLVVMAFLARMDYQRLRSWVLPMLVMVFVALWLVFIPGIGHRAGGAARWLRIGSISVQPAELAKLALVLFLARWLADNQHRAKSLFMVFLPCMGMAGVLTLPVLLEPDLGMSITIMALAAGMLFVAGTRVSYL